MGAVTRAVAFTLRLPTAAEVIWMAIRRLFSRSDRTESPAPPGVTFWAFISYSHADEAWAKWLHQALEGYRLPKTLVGRPIARGIVPRRLHPVFRDRDELPGSSSLKREIDHALEQSRSLIVICSPNAAVSRYVNEEIATFKRLGREADIYCLLVAGEPNATDKPQSGLLEAFPPAIRFQVNPVGALTDERAEPLAADVREGKDARTDAKLKLVAGILGIGFDELKGRDARRRLHQRIQFSAVALAVLLVILGVWWNRQGAVESKRQLALAQRLVDQSTELLDSEHPYHIERGVLLILEAIKRLDRGAVNFAEDSEAAQARLAADQNLRRALSLFYTHVISPSSKVEGATYEDRGWTDWTAEAIAFSSDGQALTAASAWGHRPNAAVKRWRLDKGIEVQSLKKSMPGNRFEWPDVNTTLNRQYFALSPDGEYLVTISSLAWLGEPNIATVFHLPKEREVARFQYKGQIRAVALGAGGEYLAIAGRGEPRDEALPLQIWHVPSERPITGIPDGAVPAAECERQHGPAKPKPCPRSLAFSPNNRYLAVAGAGVTLWELPKNPTELIARPGPKLDFYRGEAVAFSPDGRYLAAAGREATAIAGGQPTELGGLAIRVWELAEARTISTVSPVEAIRGLALSVGGKYLAVVDDEHSLTLRALASGQALRVHYSHPTRGGGSDANRSRFMTLSGKGPGARGRLVTVAFSPDGELMGMAGEVDPVVWRISSFDEQAVLNHESKVVAAAFDSEERTVTTVSRTTDSRTLALRTWEVESGRELSERRREEVADGFAFTPVGHLTLAIDDEHGSGRGGSVVIHTDKKIGPLHYEGDVRKIVLSPDGQHLAVASVLDASSPTPVSPGRHQVAVWHLASQSRVLRFEYTTGERDAGGPRAIVFRGDSWYLGVDDARTLESGGTQSKFVLWEMKSRREVQERPHDLMPLLSEDIAVSGDGRLRAKAGDMIHVFTAPQERAIARIPVALADREPSRMVPSFVALGSHGRYVAAVTAERTVRIWPVELSRLMTIACTRLTRELSPDEWTHYLATEVPRPTCGR